MRHLLKASRRSARVRRNTEGQSTPSTVSPAVGAVALAALFMAPVAAHAERWTIDAAVGSQMTRTSNSQFGLGDEVDDTAGELRARFAIRGEGARLKVLGSAAVSAIGYLDHTVAKQILPEADLNARLEAIERLLFLEAAYRAAQTSANPFGARPDSGSIANSRTTSQSRFSPSLESAPATDMRYRIRSDNTWASELATPALARVGSAGGYFGRHSATIERDPVPLGWRAEVERTQTRYADSTVEPLTSDLVRAGLRYAVGADVSLGVRAGSERNNYLPAEQTRSIYGVDALWLPSPRTTLSAAVDHRFFGSSWDASFQHRLPSLAMSLAFTRTIDTTPQALLGLPPTNDVAALLDAMFTTRFPDPSQRLQVVQDLIAQQGLPGSTIRPTNLYAQRLSISTAARANLAYSGVRSTIALSLYSVAARDALDSGPLATGSATTNNRQRGAALAFGHRLSALVALNAGLDWSDIRALASVATDHTIQRSVRVQMNFQLAPRSSAYIGARHRELESNVAIDGNENAVFIGAEHRF
jgi:uncharacterized protein (PEP-CTERM system associated)